MPENPQIAAVIHCQAANILALSQEEKVARRRFQQPSPKKHGNWWTIVVRKSVFRDGAVERVRERVRLLPANRGEREARRKAAEHLRPMNQGLMPVASSLTLDTFVEEIYLPWLEQEKSITTYGRSLGIVRKYLLPAFGHLCLHELTVLTCRTYLSALDSKLAFESRDKIRDVLSAILNFAVENGLLTANPAKNLKIARERGLRKQKPFLTPAQFDSLLELIPEPYATMVYVSIYTGLRASEVIGLRWDDINEHGPTIRVDERCCRGDWDTPKSSASAATIAVNRCVLERILKLKTITVSVCGGGPKGKAVRKYRAVKSDGPNDLVFQSVRSGSPMRDNNILCRFIKPAGRKIGLEWVNWQVMRRSHSNWLRMAGADLKDRQAQMRHAHPQVTADVYDQFIPERQRKVVDQLTMIGTNGTKIINCDPLQAVEMMVARDGVEPPTPAFSGLTYMIRKPAQA